MLKQVISVAFAERLRLKLVFSLIIFLFFLLLRFLFPLVSPFLFGLLIAYLIETPVALLGRWFGFPRKPAVILILLLTIFLLGLGLTLLFAGLYRETKDLLTALPGQIRLIGQGLERIKTEIATRLQWPEDFWDFDRLWMDKLWSTVSGLLQRALNLFRGFPVFLFNLSLSGFTAFFLSRDRSKIRELFLSFFPEHWRKAICGLHRQTLATGWIYLKTQFLLALITGLLATFGLALFGFAQPWLVGSLLGVCDLLPLVGPALVLLPWIGWQLAVGHLRSACFLAIILLCTVGIRQLLEFRLVGASLGLHPLLVVASLYIGVKCLGIAGVFLGPIFCVLIRSLYQALLTYDRENGFCLDEGDVR